MASVGTIFAEKVKIGDLYYNLDVENKTAEVTSQNGYFPYWNDNITVANIPSSFVYNAQNYSVTSIGNDAFNGCHSLTSITIPNSVTNIGSWAFCGCYSLTSITIPGSVTSIGNSAFSVCKALLSIDVASENLNYCSINGVLFDKSVTTLIRYPASKQGTCIIPNSVTSICERAFNYCNGFTTATIPNSVINIGNSAFEFCSLEKIILGVSVDTIGQYTFGSNYLTDDHHNLIFDERSKVTPTIKSISSYNPNPPYIYFANRDLMGLELNDDDCILADNWYISCDEYPYSSIILYVPAGSVAAYKSHRDWGKFDVRPIEAANSDVTELQVSTTTSTSVEVVWPSVSGAYTYELVIKDKQGNVVCTLVFDANGKLTSLVLAAPSRDRSNAHAQGTGFAFTITSLDYNTTYDVTVIAKDSNGQTLYQETKSFTTETPETIDQISQQPNAKSQKQIKDGQLLILRGDHTYTLQGQEVK